ncbi:MAG: SpoIIE family protein phosphatase [Ezakiella sp.]|nr:SpoIIE family protein phosphatase [Ezakiella sp.]
MSNFSLININNNLEILDFIPDWIKITSMEGSVLFANKALRQKLGFDPQGMSLAMLKESVMGALFNGDIAISDFDNYNYPSSNIFFDGRHYNLVSAPIADKYGNVFAYVDIYRDDTEQKHLERELLIKNETMQRDLELTKKIQESILPKQSRFGKLKVDYLYKPCEPISGDIFDVMTVDDGTISAYICDVSGHGVPAAMITVFVRETMRNLVNPYSSSINLSELHQRFRNLRLDMENYLTIFHILIDIEAGKISYTNAGHNCPMFILRGTDVIKIISPGKPITNYFNSIKYKEETIDFLPGDKILLITDGITECKNKSNEEYGEERVESLIKRRPDDILASLEKSLRQYGGQNRIDDMCALLIEYDETR